MEDFDLNELIECLTDVLENNVSEPSVVVIGSDDDDVPLIGIGIYIPD